MTQALEGQSAIVTGGGRGFGKSIAMKFAAEGAAVTITARTSAELDQTVKEIQGSRGRALGIVGDVTRPEDVARVVESAEKRFGPTTLLHQQCRDTRTVRSNFCCGSRGMVVCTGGPYRRTVHVHSIGAAFDDRKACRLHHRHLGYRLLSGR